MREKMRTEMEKKVKKVSVIVTSFVLVGASLIGCNNTSQSAQDTLPDIVLEMQSSTDMGEKIAEAEKETIQEEMVEEATEKGIIQEETVEEATEKEISKEIVPTKVYEDNFEVDRNDAKEFAKKVKEAVAKKDLEALAELTAFPVYVGLPNVNVVNTKEEFLNLGAETIFTEGLLKSVEMADIDNFQPSMAGFSISDGGTANINFGVSDGVLAINGINY